MAKRLAVFDLDGTLIDSRRDIAEAANVARQSLGLQALPIEEVVSFVGDGLDALIARLIPQDELRISAKQAFGDYYLDHCTDYTCLYPGVSDALAAVAQADWLIAVATNKPDNFAQHLLAKLSIDHFVGNRVRGGDRTRKPHPGQLSELLEATGAVAQESWMIGDHHTDIRAGRAVGMRIMWCAWGFGHMDGDSVDATAETPADWPRLLGSQS